MAVAAPARKGAAAPAPSRTTAPTKPAPARKRPLRPTRGRAGERSAAVAAPVRAPARKAPARQAPSRAPRRKSKAQRAVVGGQLIPLAVGRTAAAVGHLPDSGLVVRMTRGRAWIAVLGLLLVGIVALNVVTLSFAASSGKIYEEVTALEQENSQLQSRQARLYGIGAVRNAAAPMGLTMPTTDKLQFINAGSHDVATAAARLAAAAGG
jgi:hypothetical protein